MRRVPIGSSFRALPQDISHACRSLLASRSYSIWVAGSLAIGMAAAIAGLAVLNGLLFLPFPEVPKQERLARLSLLRNCGRPDCWVPMSSPGDYETARTALHSVQGIAAYTIGDVAVALPDARALRGVLVSPNYFDILGVRPAFGRGFTTADRDTHAQVAVVSYTMWTREFNADPGVIGRSIRVADSFVQIVGVAPPLFIGIDRPRPSGPRRMGVGRPPDLWLPMWLADRVMPPTATELRRQERDFQLVGRLRDDARLSQFAAEATLIARAVADARGQGSSGARAGVLRVWRVNPRNWSLTIMVVMPIPLLVLAIACVNAANLTLARGSQRQRELAIRLAIGAGRSRIVRQLLIESAGLALLATLVAVPVAWWGLRLAAHPFEIPLPIDPTVLVLTVMTTAACTIAFGLLPAVRVSAQRPASALGPTASRGDAAPHQTRVRRTLVVAQVALSLALLAGGWQLVSTVRSEAVSAGASADSLLIARFDLEPLRFQSIEVENFYHDLLSASSRMPGVQAAGLARHTAVWSFGQGSTSSSLRYWGPGDGPDEAHSAAGGFAGGELFDAVGLHIVQGRGFADADRGLSPQVAVVNETIARTFPGSAVGHVLRIARRGALYDSSTELRIVGVVQASGEPRLEKGEPPSAAIYLPSPLEPEPALALYLRSGGDATALVQPLRELVSRIGPRVPIVEIGSLADFNDRSYETQLWLARAATVLGGTGLLLATAGLYGISSYLVATRSRELAIRMAVGASPHTILTMVLQQSMRLAAVGLIAGGAIALGASRWIQSEYHGVLGIDGRAFIGAVGLFLFSMFLASLIPAARASRLDPVENLRDV